MENQLSVKTVPFMGDELAMKKPEKFMRVFVGCVKVSGLPQTKRAMSAAESMMI